jgi:hypothetical protein|tara:strand:+ start:956 stop:1402 length:447 start_codon:yes stop_codon:yes gene_type:complete
MSDYVKHGIYYFVDAVDNEMRRMPYAFNVRKDGDNPFSPDMPRGLYTCTGWGKEAHVDVEYNAPVGWENIPKGEEYYILSGAAGVFATTTEHARAEFMQLFNEDGIRRVAENIACDVFEAISREDYQDFEIEFEHTMAQASEQYEEEA